MAASPLDSSSTPHPAAVAVDPPGSPNDPMEDTYTQATRKRPRLDSGNHSNESMTMSVPSPSSDSGHYGNDQLLSSGSLVPPAATSVPEPETPNPQRPSSRVTINMKSPTLHDDSASHTVEETPAVSDQLQSEQSEQQEQHEQREQFQMSPDLTSHAQTAISITSSPSRSPEIEVAEVEDMDQDPSTSNWRSLEDALREEPDLVHMHDEVSLAESFPRLRQDCDVREAIEEIANYFERDSAPDLLSKVYLPALGWILQLHTIPFYKLMERTYGAEIINLVARVNDQLTAGPANLVKHLSEFAPLLLKALQPWPQFSGAFVSLLTIAHNVVESGMERKRYHAADELIATAELIDAVESVYTCFRSIDAEYQSYISKKSSWVTNDSSESVLRYIGYSYHNIAVLNSQLAVQMTRDLGVDVPENAKQEEYPFIIHLGWKFQVLKRHITEGRMELRVYGMETMQADLVSVWRQHIQGNPAGVNYPIIQYLVKFLRDNKIVEYIVGVDSHPQLISRSGNVVGFLVVTSTYADNDTDIIWNTVTESQDPRTVAEVLGMLTRTFIMHQSGSNALIYLCTKLIELPLNRFDARMLEYSDCLLNAVRDKHSERMRSQPYDHLHVDVVPCRLCVRLIRDATSISEFSIEQKTNLQKFASKQLSHLLTLGMDDNDKMEMYKKCIDDISEMNEFVVGSIQALNALIHPYDNLDIRRLALDFDFTRLIITELAHTFDTVSTDFSDPMVRNSLRPRIQMLLRIIEKVPETITPELSEILWSRVFMSKKIGECGRSLAWEILPKATSRALKRNPFLECYLNVYLPRISPEDYTLDILAFAEQAVSYEIRFDLPPDVNENEIITIPGMDRLWHFILTAPPGTIEMKATNFAIDVYLDHELIRTAPRSAAEATHVALVDRCVSQLTAAASKCKAFTDGSTSGEDEPMVIVPSDGEVRAEELRFTRSLLFLRQLLQGLRMRPQYTPLQVSPPESILREDEIIGEPIELSYQAFSGNSQTKIRTLKIGDLSTASELAEKLTRLTGFTSFSSFSCGQRLDLTAHAFQTLRDMKLAGSGLLMIRKNPDAFEASVGGRRQSLTLVDSEVLKHFDDLYDLLSLEEKLSKERVRDFVKSKEISEPEMFPLEKPYKLLYSIKALITCISEEILENNPDQEFVSHSIQNLVAFITRPQMGDGLEDSPLKLLFARNSVECLLFALTASMHDSRVWDAVEQSTQIKDLIFTLLLSESRQGIRKSVAEIIFATCGTTPSQKRAWKASSQVKGGAVAVVGRLPSATTIHIVATLWKHISALFPDTLEYAQSSQEFFEVALTVFQTVANLSPEDLIYGEYLRKWGDILLSHRTNEFVGREPVDYIVLGFTHLLKMCLELSHATPGTMDTSNLMEKLFTTYLFPELSEPTETKVIQSSIPVMHNTTRQEIYNILLLLCEDQANCERMLTLLDDVIPYDYTHEPNWIFDRYKTIRSPEGYAGLKNLSNTCYLNSLFTQLFMNIDFRKFMIEVHVSDVDSTQKLLAETKKVFAYMQNTWQKSVDTQETVDTIRTYDNEPIDINVQMDVDEFYNLLFDRWEGQILSTEDKKLFRSFYGGQLVQQIKSKECPHISERLEPFSAIQCDIKGKAGLEDSLRAYVEGEVMQGDNKYSCTSCGRHVDAVKRACLKDLPDNLIFHLKRFDFDVISMIRSKINDEFQFPERLDMTPYTVEYLSNPGTPIVPDIFELVGVLVHSGTAESGHYYSYIRERPTAADPSAWVEFNDSDVSRFDPSKIPDQCFGGMNDPIHSANIGPVRFNKVWNAYMLFYQRVSSMERAKSVYEASLGDAPVSVPLPMQLGNHIALENEIFIRAYCLLDPYHAYFIRALLEQSRKFSTTEESGFSKIQKPAICLALDNLDQIISRSKELPEFENIIIELGRSVNESNEGAMAVLGWTVVRPLGIRDLLLKSPNNVVRDGFCRLLIAAVARLQTSPEDESLDHDELARCRNDYEMMVENIVTSLDELWGCLHVYSRAWDDYFGLLLGLANFGAFPVQVMLEHGFLLKCLEMVWLDREDSKRLKRQYGNYFRLVEKGRKYSHSKLVEVLYVLMTHIDFTLTPSVDNSCRDCNMCKYSLTRAEAELVRPVGRNKDLIFLRKILEQQANPPVSRKIVSVFLAADPEYGLTDSICKVLEEGLRASPAYLCVPFLDATLVFCQMSSDGDRITNLIDYVSKGIDSINDSGGCEHLAFFQSLVKVKNEKAKKDEYWFWSSVVDRIPDWAPTLLHYPERAVRNGVLDFLRQLLFSKEYEDISDDFRQFYRKIGRDLAQASVDKLRRTYLSTADAQPPEVKSMETISLVIMHCTEVYFDERDSDDADFIQQATSESVFFLTCFVAFFIPLGKMGPSMLHV
ncbi:ubiquitin C-terminal hydrolase [Histoplasma capsulatum H143]|uniref:Ubiquitin C-terminal hydrolase n=1 Tax=Ajellomyces capsulatus (strain H143) TaxID=544712 RepID=C6H4R8_AJECH|nr:ubiquitin C-terminal hydrolase [Histoplasma capsulatum H143]